MLALATTSIAWIIMGVVVVGWIVYALLNAGSARKEVGSEIELAPNRKPYYDDEVLEGRRLERVQLYGVLLLVVIVIGLPLYWVLEPDRQAGATEGMQQRMINWGALIFAPTGDNTSAFNCAGCHGGMNATGGVAPYTVTDQVTGEVRAVDWLAPALNTVFYRFDEDEVRYILTYGRPGSPMSAWGLAGGGPMNAPADPDRHRVHQVDPDPPRGLRSGGGRRPALRERSPPRRDPGRHRDVGQAVRRGRHVRHVRRGAVQPRALERRLQLRPLPHQRVELRRAGRARSGRLRVEPDGRGHRVQVP